MTWNADKDCWDEILPEVVDMRWRCRCRMPDGSIEDSYWVSQGGACEMVSETEQAVVGAHCEVEPVEDAEVDQIVATRRHRGRARRSFGPDR